MTNADILQAAGWTKLSRSRGECGEALKTRAGLIGLACVKRASWVKDDGHPVCAQHALTAQEA